MKKIIFKIAFAVLLLMQTVWFNQAAAQPTVPLCPCNDFKVQAVSIAAPNGQCCYAIQIQQVYPTTANCRPRVIKLTSSTGSFSSAPVVNNPTWAQLGASTSNTFYYAMPSQPTIGSSAAWNTVATFCAPTCQSIPDMILEWKEDVSSPALCLRKIVFAPCPAALCNLEITNQKINCVPPTGNYSVTYTLTNHGCNPCTSSIILNQSHNTLATGTSLPSASVIPPGGSVTKTVTVTAVSGASSFMMDVCCNIPGIAPCCILDSIPFPSCDSCPKGCITALPYFCNEGATTIKAVDCSNGTLLNTTNITWYSAPYNTTCPSSPTDPTGALHPGWTMFQSSGNTATTSGPLLTLSTCYVAYVNISPTCRYWTNAITIYVYKTPSITTVSDIDACDPNPTAVGAAPSQTFTVPTVPGETVEWFKSADCINYTLVTTGATFSTGTLDGNCESTIYCYRVKVTNVCGIATKDFKVTVYHRSEVGNLIASPFVVCNGKASTIIRKPGCGKVTKWEKSQQSNTYPFVPVWTNITPNYGTADNFSTNNFHNNTNCPQYVAYRVTVKNGSCAAITSNPIYVQIQPNLKASIATSPTPGVTCLPPNGIDLKCSFPVCAAPLYPGSAVTYAWYRDDPTVIIGTSQIYHATQPGNYWVVVSNACGSFKTKVITLCTKPVVTLPNGCICRRPPGTGPYSLVVKITGGCSNCTYNYQWRIQKNNGPSTVFSGTGLVAGSNVITVPSGVIPPLTYNDVLHFQVKVTSSSCGTSCIPAMSNINTVSVCPQ